MNAVRSEHWLRIVSLVHETEARLPARERIRLALRTMVAEILALAIDRVIVRSSPGTSLQLWLDGRLSAAGLSITHAGRFSLAAFNAHGPVGIDLMQVQETADWYRVARDYLGPQVLAALAATPDAQRPLAFARAWAGREAQLKCLGMALGEWSELPVPCRVHEIGAPAGYAGAVATKGDQGAIIIRVPGPSCSA